MEAGGLHAAALWLRRGCGLALALCAMAWSFDLFRAVGLTLFKEQYMAAALGLALALILLPSAQEARPRGLTVRLAAAALALAVCAYIAWDYQALLLRMIRDPGPVLVCGAILMPLVAVALWRAGGTALFVLLVVFLVIGVSAHYLPGHLQGRAVRPERLLTYLTVDPNGIFGMPLLVTSTIVVAFVLFGNVLNAAGGGSFFTDLALAAMGRFRGGTAKIAVIASALFGSVSGSAVANVVSTGVITIPMMKRSGYSAAQAGGIEAAASTGGQILPPVMGAVAFLMAEFLRISYAEVALAALVPALLYYFCLFLQADLLAARRGIAALEPGAIPRFATVMRDGAAYLLPFVVLIGGLFYMGYEAERAVGFGIIATLFLWALRGYRAPRMRPQALLDAVAGAGEAAADIVVIGAAAGAIIGVLNITAVTFGITLQLVHIGEQSLFLLLVTAAVLSIVLGMGLPTLGVYLLLVTLVAPSLVELGLTQLGAHMFIFFYGMLSMITPPIAVAAFAAANLAGAPAMATGWAAMRFGWPAFALPFLFVYSPTLLLEGPPVAVALSVVTATLGVAAVTSAIVGYAAGRLAAWQRLALGIGGAVLLIPPDAIPWGLEWNGAGLVLALAGLAGGRFARRRPAGEAAAAAIPEERA